jgi:L-ascorbate metabolism protein UlaG (beta-lactamase superfamily)
MDAYAAALAVGMLRPKIAIPMHYNTYERISQDPYIFASHVKKASGTNVVILEVNDYMEM